LTSNLWEGISHESTLAVNRNHIQNQFIMVFIVRFEAMGRQFLLYT